MIISVLTGSRSEFGLLKPLIEDIHNDVGLTLQLLTTGFQLTEYGSSDLTKNFSGCHAEMYSPNEENMHARGFGRGFSNIVNCFEKNKPDFLIVVGDRLEALAGAIAASIMKIPVCQIQAGDKTDSGHIDESTRFAISQFANIMFTANTEHKNRLLKMGEESWRLFITGSINIDSILRVPEISKEKLFRDFELDHKKETALLLYHPITTEELPGDKFNQIFGFLKEKKIQTLVIYPNMDWGSKEIISKIKTSPGFVFRKTLNHTEFIQFMRWVDFMIGNSSAGLIEGPTTKTPVINVGPRNKGRVFGKNAVFCDYKKESLEDAIKRVRDPNFLNEINNGKNPYGDGKASSKIIKVLKTIDRNNLLKKKRSY